MKVGVISLGCDKNRCDSETMLHYLKNSKYEVTNDINEAEVVIVNTCAFIESARVESIETVFDVAKLKEEGVLQKLIMTGCMPQKYVSAIFDDFVEVDGFLGTNDYPLIEETIDRCLKGERVNLVKSCNCKPVNKKVTTTPYHYAYLMIADGCNNHCTYCTIPQIRGKFVSRKIEDLIESAKELTEDGAKELILVAQDVTSYGIDLYGEFKLVKLLQELSKLEYLKQIRLLYCYPEKVTDSLIEEIATNPKIVKYIDIPLQHASTSVLKRMGRFGTYESYIELFEKLKKRIPDIAIRSTVMVGFPGETEEDFDDLVRFIKHIKPLNCGVFAYSDEEDASSRKLSGKVDEETKKQRLSDLIDVLAEISTDEKEKFIGKTLKVVYEDIDYDMNCFVGRSYISAPDIDSLVFFTADDLVQVGETYNVKITEVLNDDLVGEVIYE